MHITRPMINTTTNNILLRNPNKSSIQHSFILSPRDQDT